MSSLLDTIDNLVEDSVEFINGQQGWIYLVINKLTGKKYVGQTTASIKDRWIAHRKKKSLYGNLLCDDIQLFGEAAFSIQVLHEVRDTSLLNSLEIEEIEKNNCMAPNGYNLTPGGHLIGKLTAETIAKSRTSNQWVISPKSVHGIRKKQTRPTKKFNKPVKGTNILTGEVVYLESMSSDSRFDVRLISACCKGKRQYHRNHRWEYV